MSRIGNPIRWLAVCLAATIVSAAGCGNSASGPPGGSAAAKPAAEQSFELIAETIRRRMQAPSGFEIKNPDGRSRLLDSNQVSTEIIPPTKEGEPYRAKVTILSKSSYYLTKEREESNETQDQDGDGRNNQLTPGSQEPAAAGNTGIDILDPDLVASPRRDGSGLPQTPGSSDTIVTRRSEATDERVFDLEYKDGRWILLTKPNPQTEQAISNAFEQALSSQG